MRSEQEIQGALIALSKHGKEIGYSCRLGDMLVERTKALAWVLRWCNQDGQEMVKDIEVGQDVAAFIESLG